ncbi:DnaD-like helicase loader [Cellulophaga phage phi18:3]|uniref:DNA replication protein n=1 Tax=Cellulophaga phage phi18:3 TaxID=1327983 RepID=S0A2V1_9CAUD|nr:DnaD-like helicase loader [Cellulophaga phage phi18:3]AGO48518.1 DNA replication protein [Cellulophaga phage phi18:3]
MSGWVKMHRSILDWEWYDDINVRLVFLHLLVRVNWEDKKWKGETIKRGEIISSYDKLSEEIGISVKQLRNSVSKLKRTNELEVKSNTKHTVFKVVNYNLHQSEVEQKGEPKASKGQAKGKQRATTKEDNNLTTKESKKEENLLSEKKLSDLETLEVKNNFSEEIQKCYLECLSYFPEHLHPEDPEKWKDVIDKLNRIDKIPLSEISRITKIVREDDFWSGQFLSLRKLREKQKSSGIKYIVVFNEKFKAIKKPQTINRQTEETIRKNMEPVVDDEWIENFRRINGR